MANMLDYKCPCCGANITFDSTSQQMKCNHCSNTFDVEALEEYDDILKNEGQEELNWATYDENSGSGDWKEGETDKMSVYSCNTCGGQIVGDENMGSTFCPYCGSTTVIASKFSGMLRPDLLIPFKLDKEAAMAALAKHVKSKWLAPRKFKEKASFEKISGIYVPFWLFDCDTDAAIRYRATKTITWSDTDYIYTKTEYYLVFREGSVDFERVPVDGSTKMDDAYMEAVEPFDYTELTDFQTPYLSGYMADKYDVTAEESIPRANTRIRNSVSEMFRETVRGYATVMEESSSIRLKKGQISYAMLPVWLLNTKYNNKQYTFAMNGQTGKMIGKLPTSKGRFTAFLFGFTALFAGIASLIAYFVM